MVGQPLLLEEVQELTNAALMTNRSINAVIFFMCVVLSWRFDCILRCNEDTDLS